MTQRNYKRYIGILLESQWNIESVEVGVNDKVYDPVTGQFYYEKKIVKMKVGSLIDFQWIKERISEPEFAARIDAEEKKEEGGERMPEYTKIQNASEELYRASEESSSQ